MVDPSVLVDNLVAMLRDIQDLVLEMDGDPDRIYAYHDQYPKQSSLTHAIHQMPAPSIMAVWQGTARPDEDPLRRQRKWWILGTLFVVYLSLPYQINRPMSWFYVSPRVPAMMAPLALLLPALPSVRGWQRLLFAPVAIAAVVLPLHLAKLYKSFSVRNAPFVYLLDEVPRGMPTLMAIS